jgi:hypothetical protein
LGGYGSAEKDMEDVVEDVVGHDKEGIVEDVG